jgi:hypothetical protein
VGGGSTPKRARFTSRRRLATYWPHHQPRGAPPTSANRTVQLASQPDRSGAARALLGIRAAKTNPTDSATKLLDVIAIGSPL